MAKIKFNLNFGGEQIRTLEDLRENFSIEDVLDVYNNGLLAKWLDVHNHKDELEKIKAIQATDARDVLTELIKIFGVSDDPAEIEGTLSILDYLDERKKVYEDMKANGIADYEKMKKERDELLRENTELKEIQETKIHEVGAHKEAPKPARSYDSLVQEIIYNHQDLNHIYDCLDAITTDYPDILKEKYSELFDRIYSEAPHTLYALFAHNAMRPYYTSCCAEEKTAFIEKLSRISRSIGDNSVLQHPYIKLYKGAEYSPSEARDSVWHTVEPAKKKFMIFYAHHSFIGRQSYKEIQGVTAGTYTHHAPHKLSNIISELPICEGIDIQVTTCSQDLPGGYWTITGICDVFYYLEAR